MKFPRLPENQNAASPERKSTVSARLTCILGGITCMSANLLVFESQTPFSVTREYSKMGILLGMVAVVLPVIAEYQERQNPADDTGWWGGDGGGWEPPLAPMPSEPDIYNESGWIQEAEVYANSKQLQNV